MCLMWFNLPNFVFLHIMTQTEFYERISTLPQRFQNRDLETYLCALLPLVHAHRGQQPDAELLINLLETAFTSAPAEFDPEWFNHTEAPDENIMSRKFTNPEIAHKLDKSVVSDKEDFDFTVAVIQFQIAELHRMRGKQLDDKYRYFGIDSETGNRWYNFDPFGNLECGARCILDGGDGETAEWHMTWQTLGELLEMGRIYE